MLVIDPTAIVVGAGVSGLSCARELRRRGVPAVVLERSGEVGGRCATCRTHGHRVDHGLPFLHARSTEFGEVLNELDPGGKVVGWPSEVIEPRLASLPDALAPGRRRMARRSGVNEFAAWLARETDVRLETAARALSESAGKLEVETEAGGVHAAPFVVLAAPLGESVRLAAPLVRDWPGAAPLLERLAAPRPVAMLVVIAGYDPAAFDVPFHLWYPLESVMLHTISHDSSKRDAPDERVLVLHARPAFSAEALAGSARKAQAELLWELGELLDPRAAHPRWSEMHVWREAYVRAGDSLHHPIVFESPRGGRLALVGEAFASDAGLEGAYMSGLSMGEQIGTLPAVRDPLRRLTGARRETAGR